MVLSISQAKAIQANWKTIRGRIQDYGNDLFVRYFIQNPGDLEYFGKFSNIPLTEVRNSAEFQKQTKTVMEAIGKMVDHLDELQTAANYLRERVRTHNPRHISMAQFERLLDLMPMFLQEVAGAEGSTADAWRILIADLMPPMRDEFARCSH